MAKTFAEKRLAQYEELLEDNAGMTSVSVDGQTMSLANLEAKSEYWRRRVAKQKGKFATVSTIKQSGIY